MHVLGILQAALCCCGCQALGISLDEDLLQESDVDTCLLDVLSNEPVYARFALSSSCSCCNGIDNHFGRFQHHSQHGSHATGNSKEGTGSLRSTACLI